MKRRLFSPPSFSLTGSPLTGLVRFTSHLGIALGGFSLVLGLGSTARATEIISFDDLHNTSDCVGRTVSCNQDYRLSEIELLKASDEIQYQVSEQPELGPTEFELGFRSLLDWAKEVRVVDSKGRELVSLEAEDADTRLRSTTLDTSYLEGGKLVFVKGKAFGVRARTYEMLLTEEVLQALPGKRVTFVWVQD